MPLLCRAGLRRAEGHTARDNDAELTIQCAAPDQLRSATLAPGHRAKVHKIGWAVAAGLQQIVACCLAIGLRRKLPEIT